MTATLEHRVSEPYRLVQLTGALNVEERRLSPVATEALAESAAQGRPGIILRRQDPYLLLGPQDRKLPRIQEAARWVEQQGIPVYLRVGGGSAVLLDDHCIAFGVARPCRDLTTLERNYRELAGPVVEALRELGLDAHFGSARGSYCEGPWDIVAGGRKIAGVAQAIRQGYTLVSGMVLVDQDPDEATRFVQAVYQRAGSTVELRPSAVTHLHALTGNTLSGDQVAACLAAAFRRAFPCSDDGLSRTEWARASALLTERRFLGDRVGTDVAGAG